MPRAWYSYMVCQIRLNTPLELLCLQYAYIFFSSCSASSSNKEKSVFTWSNICPFPVQIFFMCKSIKNTVCFFVLHTHTHIVSFRQGLGESCLSKTESLRPIQYSTVQCNAQAFSRSISLTEMTSGWMFHFKSGVTILYHCQRFLYHL